MCTATQQGVMNEVPLNHRVVDPALIGLAAQIKSIS